MSIEATNGGAPRPRPLVWTPELVARFWDVMSEAGLVDAWAFGRSARRCIHWLVHRHLKPGGRHLDFGAGGGEVADHLIGLGFPFAVYEPSIERQRATEARLAGRSGFLGCPTSEPYDAVTCFEVLEHVLDEHWNEVCGALVRHVRPGGKLIISVPNAENLSLDTVYCPVSGATFHRWQHVRSITPEFLEQTFAHLGVRKVCLHRLDFAEPLFEPYLHMLDLAQPPVRPAGAAEEIVPLHIHQIRHDIDSSMGGCTRLLFVGVKPA